MREMTSPDRYPFLRSHEHEPRPAWSLSLAGIPAGRRRWAAVVVLGLELVIALPFLAVSPSDLRGVPGPLLIVLCMAASFLLGPTWGAGLTAVGVVLAVRILGENAYSEPIVWIPAAVATGLVGSRVRHGEMLRREVLSELRSGLVALSPPGEGSLQVVTRYVPAETAQMLAADFYGVLETPDGDLAVLIGDVAGHGPRAAAVAARLRASWRGMTSAGVPAPRMMRILNDTLRAEQRVASTFQFATVCLTSISTARSDATVVVAGHPAPVLVTRESAVVCDLQTGPAIGIVADAEWPVDTIELPQEDWSLVFYTDGLVEGRGPDGRRPYGIERLLPALADHGPGLGREQLDGLLGIVERTNAGPLADDVVILAVSRALAAAPAVSRN